jgi:tripartite-type tricarboxylate transporter receptor subunit TctC
MGARRDGVREERMMLRAMSLALFLSLLLAPARAEEPLSFKDKQIQLIIGYGAGGTVDLFGRLIAPYLAQGLPGNPTFVARNMPGAEGIVGLNYFVNQTKPDGLALAVGGATQVDPLHLGSGHALYDVGKLALVGGNGRDGTVVVLRAAAAPRLYDKSAEPVVMGGLAAIRAGMQMPLFGGEFLGWNLRWVLGYKTAKELVLGLQRGEIDMTTISDPADVRELKASGFRLIAQSGYLVEGRLLARPELGAPLLADQIKPKLTDPVARQAYDYWIDFIEIGEFLTLAPGTPAPIVAAYRKAFEGALADPDFRAHLEATGNSFLPQSAASLTEIFRTLVDTPPAVLGFMQTMARKQGLELAN